MHRFAGVVELGGVIYVFIVLMFLTIAIPLVQLTNVIIGVSFDIAVLIGATGAKLEARTSLRSAAGATAGQFAEAAGVPRLRRRKRGGGKAAAGDATNTAKKPEGAPPPLPPPPPPARLTRRSGSRDVKDSDATNQKVDDLFRTPPSAPTSGAFSSALTSLVRFLRPARVHRSAAPYDEVSTSTGDEDDDDEPLSTKRAPVQATTLNVV